MSFALTQTRPSLLVPSVPASSHHSGAAVGGRHGSCYTTSSLNALFTTRDSMRYDHAAAGGLSAPAAIRPPPGGGAITVTNDARYVAH